MRCKLLLILVAVLLMSAGAQAVTVTTATGNGADTYLSNDDQKDELSAHGTETSMAVRNLNAARMRMLYIRFDISGLEPAEGYDLSNYLNDAYITLDCTYAKRDRTLAVYGLWWQDEGAENWDEATTTYSSATSTVVAAPHGFYALNNALSPRLGNFRVGGVGPWSTNPEDTMPTPQEECDLDSFLQADNNGLVTFLILFEFGNDSNPDWAFTTKEGANSPTAPMLTLPYAVPEPATMLILGIGSVLAMRRRK